jgi:heterodisulfide reductase subunit A-like polyferredoxin
MIKLTTTSSPSLFTKFRELFSNSAKDSVHSNLPGQEISSELIRNAIQNGRDAVDSILKNLRPEHEADYDLIIIGADPAGIAASLSAKQNRLKFLLLEQETLRKSMDAFFWHRNHSKLKIAMPLAGEIDITKDTWQDLITYYRIPFEENCKIKIEQNNGLFRLRISDFRIFTSASLLYATGINGKLCEISLSKVPEPVLSA